MKLPQAVRFAENSPEPAPEALYENIYALIDQIAIIRSRFFQHTKYTAVSDRESSASNRLKSLR